MKQTAIKLSARVCLAFFLAAIPFSSALAAELTERDWMIALVDALGWSYGLPDEPQDPDYINILTGNREFRFEAEDIYSVVKDSTTDSRTTRTRLDELLNNPEQRPARVTMMSFSNFGDFSGRGWLHGDRNPVKIILSFNLPIDGFYSLTARLRNSGHKFRISDVNVSADAGKTFDNIEVGKFRFTAGQHDIELTLPPDGSIDFLSLKAPNRAPITPQHGWQPDERLQWDVIHTTLIQVFDMATTFPFSKEIFSVEAEDLPTGGARVVSIPHLGKPSGGEWLKVGPLGAEIRIPLEGLTNGFYDLTLRAIGKSVTVVLGNHQQIHLQAKPYLDDYIIPGIYFAEGNRQIALMIPSGGGIDYLELIKRRTDSDLIKTLLGLNQTRPPSPNDLDTITTLLAAFGVER